jgi:DNA-binding beta-propeller fold protein YncE
VIALAYLAIAVVLGDALATRWFRPVTWFHRLAAAFLIGLLIATWVTYLTSLLFDGRTEDALLVGNLASGWAMALAAIAVYRWVPRRPDAGRPRRRIRAWDVITLVAIGLLVTWMMTSTYSYSNGELGIATGLWSDFGPTTAIAQNFALGDNFPTEYPHYAGEAIRYHFLFYFQVGNLTYLGLDPATANNVLSIGSMLAMLVLVTALGERLFRNAAVGRIGAALFFFHGALSFIPYLAGLGSIDRIINDVPNLSAFLSSGFPYRGEEWGIWSQIVFLNQRHLASAIGILLVIVIFLLDRIDRDERAAPVAEPAPVSDNEPTVAADAEPALAADAEPAPDEAAMDTIRHPVAVVRETLADPWLGGYVLCGALAGMLPLWNGAMFIGAAALLAVWLVIFPRRPSMLVLAVVASVVAIPQLLWVRPGTMAGAQTYPSFYWGYIVDDPNLFNVARYLAFTFGPKLLLVAFAFVLVTWRERRVLIAFVALGAVAFLLQLSVEVLANHKFINAWLIVANLFVAYGLIRLWQARSVVAVPARFVALGLVVIIVAGGVIDLMPVKNQFVIRVGMQGDRLFEWVRNETDRNAVFLTDLHVVHRILLAGRRIYFGWPYYAWSAGYAVREREDWYRQLFADRSPRDVVERLQAAGIDYVAFDDGLRERGFAQRMNQEVFDGYLQPVFTDPDNRYNNTTVYRVPTEPAATLDLPDAPAEDMYTGGTGSAPGQFAEPRGIALDKLKHVYVADTGNGRVQEFSSDGSLVRTIGQAGTGEGQLDRPTGVAVTTNGHIHVATGDGRVHEYDADGTHLRETSGPAPGFGPLADIVAAGNRVFVLDPDNGRVVRIDENGIEIAFGSVGDGPDQLREPTGIGASSSWIYVADTGNARVAVFNEDGEPRETWSVPEWVGTTDRTADVTGDGAGRIWLTNPAGDSILVYRDGASVGTLPVQDPPIDDPAGIVSAPGNALFVVNRTPGRVSMVTQLDP